MIKRNVRLGILSSGSVGRTTVRFSDDTDFKKLKFEIIPNARREKFPTEKFRKIIYGYIEFP